MPPSENLMHYEQYVYDVSEDGGAQGAFDLSAKARKEPLPLGAVIAEIVALVQVAFTSGGAGTLEWGNGSDADGYSGVAHALAALTLNASLNGYDNAAALLWDDTNDHKLHPVVSDVASGQVVASVGAADMTAGKLAVMCSYYLPS